MAEVEDAFVRQYSANVYRMAQQQGSRLRSLVTEVPMKGESLTFPRVHPTAAIRSTSVYDDSPIVHTPFSVRTLRAYEYVWGDMVDWKQDLNLLIDPTSEVTAMGAAALGRVIDDIIIEDGFLGTAFEGEKGDRIVEFPDSQKIPITTGGSSSNTGMNLAKLKEARSLFGKADIDLDNPANKLYMAISQSQLDDLLDEDKLTSNEYANVKALVNGDIDTFMGFKFIRTERLKKVDIGSGQTARTCVAWVKSAIKLAMPQAITGHISERADKNYNWYSHMKMKTGACRLEDAMVVHIPCLEN